MGLDMGLYLTRKETRDDGMTHLEIAYWRKAEQIHKWFVDNCQKYQPSEFYFDDYLVKKTDIEKLLNICKEVKSSISFEEIDSIKYIKDNNICKQLLPTYDNCDDDYDEWYAMDIDYTIKMLERILTELRAELDSDDMEVYYAYGN